MLMEATRGVGHPRYRAIIFRRTYKRLQEVMDRAWEWFPPLGAKWNGDNSRWVFPSGAMISMRHCENEEDKRIYHGHEYHFMAFDQLEEFSETQYTFLMAQCRSSVPEIVPYVRCTFNPGGIGHGWVKDRFLAHGTRECAPWTPTNEEGEELPSRCFHFSNIYDNQILLDSDPQYLRVLNSLPSEERRALRDGDWDVFAGQVFTEWRRALHVIEPIELPLAWKRWTATDYGSARPFVTLWFCQDAWFDRVYVYREVSRPGLLASEQALAIKDAEAYDESIRFRVADPAMWIKSPDSGKSIADIYGEHGVAVQKAENDRINGLAKVREFLKLGKDGTPRIQVFSTCQQLIKNLPTLVHDQRKVEDVDCWVAGTMISTPVGSVPIEDVRAGDLVDTPIGPRPVLRSYVSGLSETIVARLSDGRALEGTPHHKIYVQGKGLVPLASLECYDTPIGRNTWSKWLSIGAWSIGAMKGASTTTRMARSYRTEERAFTGRSGWTLGVPSLLAGMFTTSMATMTTTSFLTSSASRPVSTASTITGNESTGISGNRWQRGAQVQGGKQHSDQMLVRCTSERRDVNRRADIVALLLKRDTLVRSSALALVIKPLMMCRKLVRSAARVFGLGQTTSSPSKPARLIAVGYSGDRKPVFNLTVAEAHLFYANGVLSSNTDGPDDEYDAFRYGLMAAGGGALAAAFDRAARPARPTQDAADDLAALIEQREWERENALAGWS